MVVMEDGEGDSGGEDKCASVRWMCKGRNWQAPPVSMK